MELFVKVALKDIYTESLVATGLPLVAWPEMAVYGYKLYVRFQLMTSLAWERKRMVNQTVMNR